MTTTNSASNSAPADGTPGRTDFIIKYGILGWGIPCALLLTAWDWYTGVPSSELGVILGIRLVLFGAAGGIAFGAAMWKVSQRMKSRAIADTSKNSTAV